MQSKSIQNCPQCKDLIIGKAKRIIRDSCGHDKCRVCLLLDVDGCKQCLESENDKYMNISEDTSFSIKNEPAKNNYATVITYSNVHNDIQKGLNNPQNEEVIHVLPSLEQDTSQVVENCENVSEPINVKGTNKRKLKPFPSKRNYKVISLPSHISVEGEPPLFRCSICNSKFKTKGHVKYHEFCVIEKKPFACDVCPKTFILKSQLHIHKLIHLGNRPHVCAICNKAFREAGKLKRHMIHHSDEKPHVCDKCGKGFKTLNSLKLHRITHTGEKPFSCKFCSMKFNNSSNLKKHMVSHCDEKTHMCEECGKKFKQKWALTVHRRSHLHIRDFTCRICGRAFINNKDLKRHDLIHLDSKIYSCGMCSMSFRRKDNVGRHIKNAHPDKKVEIIMKSVEPLEKTKKKVIDNPNAINVITASPMAKKSEDLRATPMHRTGMNGPLKLAFKNYAFKKNYNINRDYTFDSNSKGESSQIPTTQHDSEDKAKLPQSESTKANQNLPQGIFPTVYSTPNLSIDELKIANQPDVIKNIKFRLLENFPSRDEALLKTIITPTQISANKRDVGNREDNSLLNGSRLNDNYSETLIERNNENISNQLQCDYKTIVVAATSVIVNSSDQGNVHWRRRMSQNVASEKP